VNRNIDVERQPFISYILTNRFIELLKAFEKGVFNIVYIEKHARLLDSPSFRSQSVTRDTNSP
jgi:hypothetical protein